MTIFNLPDLGEGLPDAEIVKWHVNTGDTVCADDILVSMETAKAIVDVPSPYSGKIKTLFGKVGDIINTGNPLLEFDKEKTDATSSESKTVTEPLKESSIPKPNSNNTHFQNTVPNMRVKAMPSVRALARKLEVDLNQINPTGPKNRITSEDVKNAVAHAASSICENVLRDPLRGVRRAMANAMTQSHAEVVPVTLVDDADIHSWLEGTDITWRVIRAMIFACQKEPALNAHFDMKKLERHLIKDINIGIAMDSGEGLFVPVLQQAQTHDQASFRNRLTHFKQAVKARNISPTEITGSTIQLSNFGNFAGRYANPIVVPPNVAIVGTGKIREEVVAVNHAIAIHKIMPLSLTIDHRAITGGEAARFLQAIIEDLRKSH